MIFCLQDVKSELKNWKFRKTTGKVTNPMKNMNAKLTFYMVICKQKTRKVKCTGKQGLSAQYIPLCRDVFGTQPNIYDGVFVTKIVNG